ncbi:MAG TPA: RNA-binding cell elongation regulator Jag/EloR [Clostridiales bacterium]|nr:RNA-binding cell elongation regulator Jag/EloR [Clostridiales bacterium]
MKTLEKSGKTVDEAIELALAEMGKSREEVNIEIVTMPSKGIFGIGSKSAVVKVSAEDGPTSYAIAFLTTVFEKFELDVTIESIESEDFVTLDLIGKDLGILIGRRGETLDALQYLTNLTVARHFDERNKYILDVEGYRKKREETLEHLAKKLAERVKESGKNLSLEPMSPYERRIIHTVLQSDDQVRTFSEGEEPFRKVVIAKKK